MSDYVTARAQTREMRSASLSRPAAPQLLLPPEQVLALPAPPSNEDMELDSTRDLSSRRRPAAATLAIAAAPGDARAPKQQRTAAASSAPAAATTQAEEQFRVVYENIGKLRQLDTITQQLQQLTATNTALTTEVRAFKTEIQSLQAQLVTQGQAIQDLTAKLTAQDTEITKLREDLAAQVDLRDAQLDDSLHARAVQYAALEEQRASQVAAIAKQVVLTPYRPQGAAQPDLVQFGQHTLESVARALAMQPSHIQSIAKIRARPEGGDAGDAADSHSQLWHTGQPCCRIEVHFKHAEQKRVAMLAATRKSVKDAHNIQVQDKLLPAELREKAQLNSAAYDALKGAGIKVSWRRSRITWWVERPAAEGEGGAWALLSILEAPEGTSSASVVRAAQLAAARALAAPQRRRTRRPGATGGPSASAGSQGHARRA